jgi:uncharacterized protein involved in response to NO
VAPLLWHAHEMLFGFAVAVIVGFLLTAGKAWTGLPTPRGAGARRLGRRFGLRRASRHSAASLRALRAARPAAAAAAWRRASCVLLRAGNRRNLPLAASWCCCRWPTCCFHLSGQRRALALAAAHPCTPRWR